MVLDPMYLLIAYSGLLIHILMKLAELPGKLLEGWTKKDWLVTIASAVSIPILLMICTDTTMKDILPINYVTAFLAGYQTQSFLKGISTISGKMKPKSDS